MRVARKPQKTAPNSLYGDVIAGYSLPYAASRRKMSFVDAQAEFQRELDTHRADKANAPDVERARLERLLLALQPGIDAGDVASIREGRGISESIRKLDGLDARPDDAPVQAVKVSFSFADSGLRVAGRIEGPGTDDMGQSPILVGGDGNKNGEDDGPGGLAVVPDSGR